MLLLIVYRERSPVALTSETSRNRVDDPRGIVDASASQTSPEGTYSVDGRRSILTHFACL